MEEIFDIYTKNGKKIGTAPKSKCHGSNPGFYHKPVWIWIINSKNQILIQKRAKSKKLFPNLWDMPSAGHVKSKETSLEGAIRETYEELGVETNAEDYEFITEYIYNPGWEIAQIYILKLDMEIEKFNLEEKEVETVKWLNYDEFIKVFYSNEFVPFDKEYKDMICEILKKKLSEKFKQ